MQSPMNISEIFRHDKNFQDIMSNMLQTTLEISFDGVMITEAGPGHPIIYVNPAFSAMTGYTPEEIMGKSPSILQGEKTEQHVLDDLKVKIEAGKIFHGKTKNYRKDGSDFIMEWKIVPIRDKAGQISHYLAIQREITDEKLDFASVGTKIPFGF